MKKTLWISNIITLVLLIFLLINYKVPQKIYQKAINHLSPKVEKIEINKKKCKYELIHYDFHYKKESLSPKIVMFGNSLVKQGDWSNILDRKDVINRGIAGDKLYCMTERLKYFKKK